MSANATAINFKVSRMPQINIKPEVAAKLAYGEITLAQFAGLSQNALYRIADVAYQLFQAGNYNLARQIYQGLIAADPFDSVFHCHLGAIYHRIGDLDKAMEEYSTALRFNFSNSDALAGRGEIYFNRGKLLEAFNDLKAAIELDPEVSLASTVRARAILATIQEIVENHLAMAS
jgi:tetratricopeptide (TPR) repeat protein